MLRPFVRALAALVVLGPSVAAASSIGAPGDPSAIFGGGPVDSCAWPSTVFLENCTGTLIHPEVVVYAAHCGADRERAWFGEDISTGAAPEGAGFSVDVEYCMVNPEFSPLLDVGPWRAADFAFCKLVRPVVEVPIVPPLMGCETTILTPGTDVTLVGYGGTDQDTFGVKFQVDTVLHYLDDFGAAVIGGDGLSPCAGDSGGPAFVQLPDGTWRAFGIVSGPNVGNCGDAMWFATIFHAIPFIEKESGIDVTACHFTNGEWNPSPACGGFPLAPMDGTGTSWATNCAGGPISEWSDACGPAFDASEDLVGPVAAITEPPDRTRFDTAPGEPTYALTVVADASDVPSGVSKVELEIDGTLVDGSVLLSPPWTWELTMPPGVWEIAAVATDWAGNVAASPVVVIGIDEDPPAAPEGSTSSGSESSTGMSPGTTGEGSSTSGVDGSESTGGAPADSSTDGCGCRSDRARFSGLLALSLLFFRRRRDACSLALAAAACSSDPSASHGDDTTTGTETSTTTSSTSTETGTTTEGSATTESSSSTGDTCEVGTLRCACTESFTCEPDLICELDTCVPCETGTFACPCAFLKGRREGMCDEGLSCMGGLCATPRPCPFEMDGECDSPGVCQPGTDGFDCCPTQQGVCEEASQGGACPDGSDPDDCGGASESSTTGTGGGSESTGDSTGTSGSTT